MILWRGTSKDGNYRHVVVNPGHGSRCDTYVHCVKDNTFSHTYTEQSRDGHYWKHQCAQPSQYVFHRLWDRAKDYPAGVLGL